MSALFWRWVRLCLLRPRAALSILRGLLYVFRLLFRPRPPQNESPSVSVDSLGITARALTTPRTILTRGNNSMATFNKFNSFVEYLAEKVFDLENDSLKIVLTDTVPDAANTVYADLTEIADGNGYTSGGVAATIVSSGQTDGTYKLVLNDLTISAAGGSVGPFRYFVLIDATPTTPDKPLIGWWDYGSSITLADGESITVDFSATDGVLQIS
jgi:hypothetical protein